MGVVNVPADKPWGAQTQRSLEHFSIGQDLIPREMITAYAILKKAAANANHTGARLDDRAHKLIVQACDEILAGQHHDMFPLHVRMTGSGMQFNVNVNEVISNRCCQLAGTALGSKTPVHPNDHVNMSQSSNDIFPSTMYIAAAVNVKGRLLTAVTGLCDAIAAKAEQWEDIVKIGRTHMQDAMPITLGQEWSGYAGMLSDDIERIEDAPRGVYRLALGGTAVGTRINAAPGFAEAAAAEIARLPGCRLSAHQTNYRTVGMAIYATKAKRVTDPMFIEAAHATADQVTPEQLKLGMLFPLQSNILEVEVQTAARVAKLVFDSDLARVDRPADIGHLFGSTSTNPSTEHLGK